MAALKRGVDAGRLLLDFVTRDPAFVRGGDLAPGDIPVFTFHSLEPRSFERRMRFLRDAGYQGIGLGAYLAALFGRAEAPSKSVLITIDDGRASTWTVGYPILKALGMRATAFLVTSVVHDSPDVSKTIGDVGESEWPALVGRDETEDRPFITWGEALAMRDTIDLASHSHLHARVPTSGESSGVMTREMQTGYGQFDCPFLWIDDRPVRGKHVPVGTPLPASVPRLSGRPAYRAGAQRFETTAEVREAIHLDLSLARQQLKERAGVETTALCFPWHVDSPLARQIAAESGYVAGFVGKASTGPTIARRGGDPLAIPRVGEDYVERLPGPGRRSLVSVLRAKLSKR